MKKRAWVALVTLMVGMWFVTAGCSDPFKDVDVAGTDEEVTIDETETEKEKEEIAAGTRRAYALTPESSIIFEGSKVIDTRVGGFSEFEGTITVPEGDPERARIEVTIDTTSLFSDSNLLTRILKGEDFFHVENYPTSKFISTGVEKVEDNRYRITGNLTMRDITKSISFTAQVSELTENQLSADAEFLINRNDWNVGYDSWEGQLIKDEVKLALYVVAKTES
mgnify:CR=1 FL=1